jgi:hypothetical protein
MPSCARHYRFLSSPQNILVYCLHISWYTLARHQGVKKPHIPPNTYIEASPDVLGTMLEKLGAEQVPAAFHNEVDTDFDRSWRDEQWKDRKLSQAAQDQTMLEKDLPPMEAIRSYPMVIFWCLMISTCVIMEGYDTILIGNFYGYPTSQKKYGDFVGVTEHNPSGHQLSAAWMAGLGNASGVGAFFGTLLNGYLVALFWQKRILLCALVLLSCLIFMTFFAPNIKVLTAGEALCGLPWYASTPILTG